MSAESTEGPEDPWTAQSAGQAGPEDDRAHDQDWAVQDSPEEACGDAGGGGAHEAFPVVGIGASAGGLEALQAFFRGVQADSGIAYVVVTHVKPERLSILPELIGEAAPIPVVPAEDGVEVEPDKVVVAKDNLPRLSAGRIWHVRSNHEPEVSHHPIDFFFRSLAEDCGPAAIGVILSGSGHDGKLGIAAIKEAGGMAMTQSPQQAGHPGMPDSAISTGLVDYILPVEKMPNALVEYCRGPFFLPPLRAGELELPPEAIRSILLRLRSQIGHDFTGYKTSTMSRRIQRRMNVHHIEDPQTYLELLGEDPREQRKLLQELLISVTRFFRDREAFEALNEKVLARLARSEPGRREIRVWVPGCATGEEAYSVAMLLREQLNRVERACDVQVFATDLDERAIEVAREGVYPAGIAVDVTPERLRRHFVHEDGKWRVDKRIRDRMVFAVQNVISDPPFIRQDLIVCRNLLIYLDGETQQQVLPTLHYALRPGGVLFLGSSENLGDSGDLFEPLDAEHQILRRRETHQPVFPGLSYRRPVSVDPEAEESGPARRQRHDQSLVRCVQGLLLERFAPCAVLVDEDNTVAYLHGRSGLYLEPEQGTPRNNVLEMAREGLRPALSVLLGQARRQGQPVRREAVHVQTNGSEKSVDISAELLDQPQTLRGLALVIIQPSVEDPGGGQAPVVREVPKDQREELERELRYTRENLQTSIEELETSNEELKSSNEELQSTNEELQSANEELETSREEMQSLNEELSTVNAELQSKVDALAQSNDDMRNLLNSMQVATIFLDRELKVKRYTSQTRKTFRLIESDLGRPLADLQSQLQYDDMLADCRKVLAELSPIEREVQDADGRWYLVRIMPYRTAGNLIDGVVVSMVDIQRAKLAEKSTLAARAARDFFRDVVQALPGAVLVLDEDFEVVKANDAFHRTFRTRDEEIEGQCIDRIGQGGWDDPVLQDKLQTVRCGQTRQAQARIENEFPWIGWRRFDVTIRRVGEETLSVAMVLMGFEDITEGA